MVIYKCNKCDKKYNHKHDYIKHINRKYSCSKKGEIEKFFICHKCNKSFKSKYNLNRHCNDSHCNKTDEKIFTLLNLDLENQSHNLNLNTQKNNTNINLLCEKNYELQKIPIPLNDTPKNLEKKVTPIIKYECEYCLLTFSKQFNLNRHLKGRCKEKNLKENKEEILQKLLNQMHEEMKQLKDEIVILKHNPNNIINNTQNSNNNISNTQINNNNINIVAFGKEKLDELVSDTVCRKILFKGFEAVPKLIEYIHFNEKRPNVPKRHVSLRSTI